MAAPPALFLNVQYASHPHAQVESRFRFLAADSSATIRGRRPSYRETLLSIRDRYNRGAGHPSLGCVGLKGVTQQQLRLLVLVVLLDLQLLKQATCLLHATHSTQAAPLQAHCTASAGH